MALPSSSSASRWKYDVFLSFRGEDTRTNFTDHLYAALKRTGIHTFRDDNELERGEEIGPELLKAIEDSRFSIIVFSSNYASSTWCLDELAHIIKCKKTLGQTVLPVFYDVDPSVVRKQKRSFQEAFAGHEERFKEEIDKLERWRAALREAANLKGVDVRNDADRHESTIINNIVKEISDKLNRKRLSTSINPVGLHSRANAVISLLYEEPIDVRIVGIYGMGGIGKTTIAKEVYNSIFPKFEGSCFLADVRQNFNIPKDRVHLQNQLLSEILKGKHKKIYNVDRGLEVIQERLHNIRVLIVLDDVDELEQLSNILGNCQWLFPGSRIIITTRFKDLLKPSRVYRQYQVEELDRNESLQLFSINAFGTCHPMKEYMECSESVVHYAGGIPLALEVLGSSLSGQNVDVWKSRLEKLEAIPDQKIQNILEISYNSLDDIEKYIFLDIACFFIGKEKDYVIRILDGCGFFPIDGINTLAKRCLLKIDSYNKLEMHDLLQDMGREIVRRECPIEPGKRSRVWRHGEAFDLLTDKTGTKAVEGLSLNLPGSRELLSTKAFKKMNRLRLLQLNYVNLTGSYEHISKKLRWLCWHEFPLESIPADLHMGNVVALDMRYSSLKQVWEEVKFLGRLKFLDLSHSRQLTKTPNFKELPILEILLLEYCTSLVDVHESIGLLTKLVILNLKDCRNLKNLPRSICALRSLENLNISGCSKLDELPEELGNMKSLVVFAADGTAISRVPETIADLENLRSLSLQECQLIPSPVKGPIFISFLPVSLRQLDLRYCNLSDDMIPNDLLNLSQLEDLKLCGNNFSSLPVSISLLPKLRHLWLNECKRLQSVPELQSSLLAFEAKNCTSLEKLNLTNYGGIPGLYLDGCHKLVEVEGFFKLEPIGVDFVKKLLGTLGLSIELASIRVHIINNLTGTSMISPLQGLSESGIYSIFLPGSEIPSWFNHQSKGDSITFNVPPLQDCKILGFIICAVYAWEECSESCFICPQTTITNKTKMFDWLYEPKFSFFLNEVKEDVMWLSYWRFENKMEGINEMEVDMSWRFKNEMEGGDQVEVSIDIGYGIQVKKCGVSLLYEQNDQVGSEIKEPAMMPRASSKHFRSILLSIPHWLTFHRHLSITSHERIGVHNKNWKQERKWVESPSTSHNLMDSVIAKNEYMRWVHKRGEQMNQRPLPISNEESMSVNDEIRGAGEKDVE